MKFILGITGPTGAGKSSALKVAEKNGFFCIDCDKTAHSVTSQNVLCVEALKENFGNGIFKKGALDRAALAKEAFKTKENTLLLNETVLPFIVSEILNTVQNCGCDKVLLDAPTLFESGLNEICNCVIAIISDFETRKKRIIKRDMLNEESAMLRLNAGKGTDFYIENADYIIENNSDLSEFEEKFEKMLHHITEE